ncbi:MAG: sulfotransferase family protein, partial [Bacteroidia bacterium]
MKNIQFIGTQRSGSNLLRVMLHELPGVCAPHPPHILQVMYPFLPMYGDLADEHNFMLLIDDACQLVEKNPVSWNIHFDRNHIRANCANNSLPQIAKAIYEAKANDDQATWWCCKSMANIHFVDEIEAAGIEPFYLYLYRDGRDVALSFLKAIVGEKHIYHLAKQWREEQMRSLELCTRLPETRYLKMDYETFIAAPEIALQKICAKTGILFSENALHYNQSEESRETAASGLMWSN